MSEATAHFIGKKTIVAVFVTFAVVFALAPSAAFAASSTSTENGSLTAGTIQQQAAAKKTVKFQKDTSNTSTIKKKAATVKKGTTNLTIKKGEGFIRFKAPAAKKYTFTFSNLKGQLMTRAFVEVKKPQEGSPMYSSPIAVATQGGKSSTLYLGPNGKTTKYGKKIDWPLKSRYATVNLKKGEEIYFWFYSEYYLSRKDATMKLVIK